MQRIETNKAAAPSGWYSQAYRVGDIIYTAGVTGVDPVTQQLVSPGDIVGQTHMIMQNMNTTNGYMCVKYASRMTSRRNG